MLQQPLSEPLELEPLPDPEEPLELEELEEELEELPEEELELELELELEPEELLDPLEELEEPLLELETAPEEDPELDKIIPEEDPLVEPDEDPEDESLFPASLSPVDVAPPILPQATIRRHINTNLARFISYPLVYTFRTNKITTISAMSRARVNVKNFLILRLCIVNAIAGLVPDIYRYVNMRGDYVSKIEQRETKINSGNI